MNFVLVDTSVWSLLLRKKTLNGTELKIRDFVIFLMQNSLVIIIGEIRQETLSGISDQGKFLKLKDALRAFSDFEIPTEDFEDAAENFNLCRSHGIQGSHTDFLICAVAKNHNFSILTLDNDFLNYNKYINFDLIDLNAI